MTILPSAEARLQGTLTTFASGGAALTLTRCGETAPVFSAALTDGSYCIGDLLPGNYTLTLSKPGHGTRSYDLTLEVGDNTRSLKLHLLGDTNGDGKINVGDVSRAYAKGTGTLDPYGCICADLTHDGKINMGDISKLYKLTKSGI